MFITVEGAIGVGKTSLVNALAARPGWQRLHEEYDTNPFLHALYEDPQHYGLHAQITFLFLQDRQMQHAARLLACRVDVPGAGRP